MHGLFITGTDTGVGKTFLTALLAQQLQLRGITVGIYKPVCSGAEFPTSESNPTWPDIETLSAALEHKYPQNWICPQRFPAPLAPPVAAAQAGKDVNATLLRTGTQVWQQAGVDCLLVEGVGGWKCPLTETETVADLARDLNFPVLVVAANRLGMINHTLLTLEAIEFSSCKILGAVVNNTCGEDDGTGTTNIQCLRQQTRLPIFGPLPWMSHLQRPLSGEMCNLLETLVNLLLQTTLSRLGS